jgi:hypothetical protein
MKPRSESVRRKSDLKADIFSTFPWENHFQLKLRADGGL